LALRLPHMQLSARALPDNQRRMVMKLAAALVALFTLAAPLAPAAAQTYPSKRIDYYIAFVAGGESDVAARFQQVAFRKLFKQEMTIQYKPGAGGGLMWSQINSLPPDGHAIIGINLPHIVLQPMEGIVQYKTDDITPVYWFHYTPDAIVVANDSPYKTFGDLVKAAKAKPGEVTLAGSGTNSANHLAHEKLNGLSGIKTTYIPFKGTGELNQAVIGKHIHGALSYVTLAIGQKTRMRMLAVALDKRHPQFPDVPTFKELGFNWVDGAYRGVAVPKSTPPNIQKQVSDMIATLNKDPDLRKQNTDGGFEIIDIPVEKNAAFMKERVREYTAIAKRMGLAK
jgi:tripartite-type tricarboxylate transporter receptor subunit TctC